ncbi:hypothetical protein GCM10009530_30280 [Microbispora corallina]|uniref:Uncharacterized protein n=1 Tax=Microbispora corallina TaxID=83302 RepID=A0ABQ4G0R7_9ACTN|nr:hypothetical protein [Microbispora corallina]GIH40642.1 hypothetical protein Mco01_36420 [Microbispora corallina]
MPKLNNLVGVLAISAAMTGGAVALGNVVTATSANAATVMGGYVGGPSYVSRAYPRLSNRQGQGTKNKNKNKQWQHERQHQNQHQFLLRDFTLVLTPFQKTETDSRALPYNWQASDTRAQPWNRQDSQTDTRSNPKQKQDAEAENENDPSKKVEPTPTVTVTVTAKPMVP